MEQHNFQCIEFEVVVVTAHYAHSPWVRNLYEHLHKVSLRVLKPDALCGKKAQHTFFSKHKTDGHTDSHSTCARYS